MYKDDEMVHDSSCDSDNWQIFYWNLQKQVWWEFTARKNAGISEKFSGKVLESFAESLQENFNGEKGFTGEMGNQI